MNHALRPPAVPLATIDPYFSVWSFADQLHDDFTRHWTGKRNAMTGVIVIDGVPLIFAGKVEPNSENYFPEPARMKQISVDVSPLSSKYVFSSHGVELTVVFTSPLLLDNLDVLSRPVSYVSFYVRSVDGKSHDVKIYFDISGEWCVNTSEQKVVWGKRVIDNSVLAMHMGTESQKVLERFGDDVRIDWGYMHLVIPNMSGTQTFIGTERDRKNFISSGKVREDDSSDCPAVVRDVQPIMASVTNLGTVGENASSFFIALAYDDIKSIEYFGEHLDAYWRRNGVSFDEMLMTAIKEYDDIMQKCNAFEKKLVQDAMNSGGKEYADLISLAYRQAIAAHKLVCDTNGDILFISKECFSNGCAATVDVSYPSIPLFLLYNTELVKGMMRPIFKYAASDAWKFDFAPHDAGCYPKVNGQVYGENKLEYQMPVEECGNMLVMCATVSIADRDCSFAKQHWDLIEKWGNYLMEHGLDPENQLCTDDFAGHLAHNCNLSVKAIMGIAGYSIMCDMLGKKDEAAKLLETAKKMAVEWELKAKDGDHYKLAFNQEGTWSLKYNLVWDKIFGTGIFADEIFKKELAYYLTKKNKYGIPLDSRADYTKTDWLVWVASMADSRQDFDEIIHTLWDFANESLNRVPFTDWYDTIKGSQVGFQHRSVLGGIFIKILKDSNKLRVDNI
ncbi:glutaminase [Clostridium thermosuccinogenes]|uniref:Glutaminase n=1 Tax=Clostridium thermosuccinogenes TaxID=84032 RepID=A0A2K2FJF4_9CLOT|nr:glutaminase family protein [Pseudoclostridium thermosuccinogenes]AUS98414.1 glutaminase [Pseudoclostridium thermosuccinogenes]PNT98906.1 glutaminase [Pseudoclostridium thermosuccinogenes]PNU00821.1 glutaminase [Pseudoclostridium thermosuccinogenes]